MSTKENAIAWLVWLLGIYLMGQAIRLWRESEYHKGYIDGLELRRGLWTVTTPSGQNGTTSDIQLYQDKLTKTGTSLQSQNVDLL